MSYDYLLKRYSKLILIRLVVLIFLFAPMAISAQEKLIIKQIDKKNDFQSAKSMSSYQSILKQSGKEFLWFESNRLTFSGLNLHRLLADLGLFELAELKNLSKAQQQQFDVALTAGFLSLIKLHNSDDPLVFSNAESVLLNAFNNGAEKDLLFSLIPKYEQVSQLRKAIAYYRLLSTYPWPAVDVNFRPKLGQSHQKITPIREILTRLGDLPQKMQTRYRLDVFDSVVVNALEKFQLRHGLSVDGQLGKQTYAALQVPPEQRIEQLQVNLWRWFSLPKQPDKYLLVNIPSYQLSIMEYGEQALQMKVIVGDSENQTPLMITKINQITFNPTWTPTFNIIKNELIPEYEKDFLSLKRKNFQLVQGGDNAAQRKEIDQANLDLPKLLQSYRLVQAPGSNNALGYYRFNIPNNQSIYLHDTPVKSLFNRPERALSHGCVRLEDAGLLAKYLLSFEDKQNEKRMFSALDSGKTKHLPLNNALPVYITYQTAWFNKEGTLHFSPDIYSLDKQLVNLQQSQTMFAMQ